MLRKRTEELTENGAVFIVETFLNAAGEEKGRTKYPKPGAQTQAAQETLTDIQTLFDENGLVWQSSEALSQATEKLNRMDIESLNSAIRDLGAVVEPLAEFFGKFKR